MGMLNLNSIINNCIRKMILSGDGLSGSLSIALKTFYNI